MLIPQDIPEQRIRPWIKGARALVSSIITAVSGYVQHEYREFIAATIHAHTTEGNCTEVMILTADAEKVRDFLKKLRSQKKVMKVDISLVGGGK